MRISSKERKKRLKNKSFDSQSIISSDYVFLKNGNVKRKRNKNSYFETFLEKRRMAAEFAQSKRCYSTVSTKITYMNKNNNKLSLHGLQDILNMKNLQNNLPGKATSLIDNTNNIINSDSFFIQNNIINKNNSLSQPAFEEIKHLTNKSNVNNNEYNNNLNKPYELDNDTNEETSKFANQDRIIDTNKSRKIEILPSTFLEKNPNESKANNNTNANKNNYYKFKYNNNTYIKKRPIRDENGLIATLRQNQNQNQEINTNNNNNQVEASISFRNDLNNNMNIKDKNNNINNINIIENVNSNDFSIKYNDKKNKDINRYIDTNNNEENDTNINFFNNIMQKNDININKSNKEEEIITENNKSNITDPNDISNEAIEETNVIKVNDNDYLDIDEEINKQKNIYKDNNNIIIERQEEIKQIYERKENIQKNKQNIKEKQKYFNIPKIDTSHQNKEKVVLKEINRDNNTIFKKYNNEDKSFKNKYLSNFLSNETIDKIDDNNNNISLLNKNQFIKKSNKNIDDSKNNKNILINNNKNDNNKNINLFSLMINKDLERLNNLKKNSQTSNKEQNYFDEINNLIKKIKGRRDSKNEEFENINNENREKLLELENKRKDLKLTQSQINTALNYNKKKIMFPKENEINKDNNILESKKAKNNKFKISITSRMQNLLNNLKKEKISNNIEEYDDNSELNYNNKSIFTQNVINSINNFIKEENNQFSPENNSNIHHINNINSNNHSNNFIVLQNYYNNENNNKKYKKIKTNFNNYISFDNSNYTTDRNFISDRESKQSFNMNINKNDINELDQKISKLIKNKYNYRLSKSKPTLNLSKPNINIFENDNKYGITSNNSRGFGKSIDYGPFVESHTYIDKNKEDRQNKSKNSEIEWYKSKSKRSSDYSSYFNLNYNNNKLNNNNNCEINIMPVNNIKSIFKSFNYKK